MGVVRRGCVRAYAEPKLQRMEIVTEIGDDIRIYGDDSAAGMLQNRFWGG
jgi:hypothetical protein